LLVIALQLGERRLHVFARLGVEQLEHRLGRQRLGRREDQRLENRLDLPARRRKPLVPLLPFRLHFLPSLPFTLHFCLPALQPSLPAFLPSSLHFLPSCPAAFLPCRFFFSHDAPPGRRSDAARRPAASACRHGSGRSCRTETPSPV